MSTPSHLLDIIWILLCASLGLIMQAGFCCLESGLVRSKNSINVAIKNFIDICIASAFFWICGFAIMFGAQWKGLMGTTGFFFSETENVWLVTFFLFQAIFCGTAVTIISGAVSERMKFTGYIVVVVTVSAVIYPFFGHWTWGGRVAGTAQGWLEAAGFIDFAGSTVVHSIGAWVALSAIIIIGPRLGRFDPDMPPIRGQNLPMSTLGVFLLWIGWFGFNGGNTLAITDKIPIIFLNTFLAGVFGGISTLAMCWWFLRRLDVAKIMNGCLAGLVGITASAHIMSPPSAVVIGAVSGGICLATTVLLDKLKIDDVVGAVPVHGATGVWGTLAVALLANPESWGTGLSRWDQFVAQAMGVGTAFVWGFGVSFIIFSAVNRVFPLRVSQENELVGLNVSEHEAVNEVTELLVQMEDQINHNSFSGQVMVEPHTEIGQIATQYNSVLDQVNFESAKREDAVKQLERETASLELSKLVAIKINESTNVDEVLQYSLEQICAWANWPVGHVYMGNDNSTDKLFPTNLWHLSCRERFDEFRRVTMKTHLGPGVGLPGRVLNTGKPVWIRDVTQDASFRRAELGESMGIKAGFAFPVSVGKEIVAVLEFFSEKIEEPDEHMLQVVGHIGTQLGRIIERERSEIELTAHRDQLQGLVNVATRELQDNAAELKTALSKEKNLNKLQREFVSMASHEFRTPLAIIDQAAQRMKRRIDENRLTPEDTGKRVKKIRDAVQRMTRLMKSTLDASRMEEGKIQIRIMACNIGKIIREICARQQDMSPNHEISCNLDGLPPSIQADCDAMEHVITNVLANAVKYAPNNPDIQVKAHVHEGYVIIQVRDFGIGIDKDELSRIGERFFRARTSTGTAGTGIGLNLAKTLVGMHNGTISVESRKGGGSTFSISLPVTGPARATP